MKVMRQGTAIEFKLGEEPFHLYKNRPCRQKHWKARIPGCKWNHNDYMKASERRPHPHEVSAEATVCGYGLKAQGTCVNVERYGDEGRRTQFTLYRDTDGTVTSFGFRRELPAEVIAWADKHLKPWNREIVLHRYPRIVAHMICLSLGYATPNTAAGIVAAAMNNEKFYCEWINHCYRDDPVPALQQAIKQRQSHHGYMAEYVQALKLVCREILGKSNPEALASWF